MLSVPLFDDSSIFLCLIGKKFFSCLYVQHLNRTFYIVTIATQYRNTVKEGMSRIDKTAERAAA